MKVLALTFRAPFSCPEGKPLLSVLRLLIHTKRFTVHVYSKTSDH